MTEAPACCLETVREQRSCAATKLGCSHMTRVPTGREGKSRQHDFHSRLQQSLPVYFIQQNRYACRRNISAVVQTRRKLLFRCFQTLCHGLYNPNVRLMQRKIIDILYRKACCLDYFSDRRRHCRNRKFIDFLSIHLRRCLNGKCEKKF